MKLSICSYSFHRMLAAGKQDIFGFITACKEFGCTQLDPWMAHLALIQAGCAAWRTRENPLGASQEVFLTSDEIRYLAEVKRAGDAVGLPFGCIAVDGGHIVGETPAETKANRAIAFRWIDVCAVLGATQVRIDTGFRSKTVWTAEDLEAVKTGYAEVIARAKARGVEVVVEDHMGPTRYAEPMAQLLEAVPGLALLWDSFNWAPGERDKGRAMCAKYARMTHIKAFEWDANGEEPKEDLPGAIACLKKVGYAGTWGVESTPNDGDEMGGCGKTIEYLRKHVG